MTVDELSNKVTHSPGSRLLRILESPGVSTFLGVHDALSARIAADCGYPALWASGLGMSTALGLRDCDEASWTELLDITARMVEATNLPILVDGDTGYGNFNTARRFAMRAERAGAAGVCIEDKVFPKMNSFVGDGHALAPIPEFCGKIAACKDAVRDSSFVLVARVEALIAGAGMGVALERAEAYRAAGADAIFIHSRMPTVAQIAEFTLGWNDKLPLIIAPTTYHRTPIAEFERLGISGVIWANQAMRAAVAAVKRVCAALHDGPAGIDSSISSLPEVFSLLDYDALERDEQLYGSYEHRNPL
ncbi:phosphoenolpyruvate phosphomutase [Kibdelosporangium banguiense]|uniref:Phosphoenolpyruvate phosphomutase n=1 Tax=Kibdelosporangium banguiense TaxID=1365924 RepID=A0ABS4TGI6_9PSEU|nr:isocitrate lyase/phosphoenolpyruvate mutase family protein [Kibdelosporangium banguiense]MBP2323135.1 phosphoenolpyruvate phosphomutase [Kibdelosporangium banguiense]